MAAAPLIWMLSGLLGVLIAALGFNSVRSTGKTGAAPVSVWQSAQLIWGITILALLLALALFVGAA